jgi:hypothetical protein
VLVLVLVLGLAYREGSLQHSCGSPATAGLGGLMTKESFERIVRIAALHLISARFTCDFSLRKGNGMPG